MVSLVNSHANRVACVGGSLKICPWVTSRGDQAKSKAARCPQGGNRKEISGYDRGGLDLQGYFTHKKTHPLEPYYKPMHRVLRGP